MSCGHFLLERTRSMSKGDGVKITTSRYRGDCYDQLGQHDLAMMDYNNFLELSPLKNDPVCCAFGTRLTS
jgi:hypothetical protein